MQRLQDLHAGDHCRPAAAGAEPPSGILEDPGSLTAGPQGHRALGPHLTAPEKRLLGDIQWWNFHLEFIEWRYDAARALLLQRAHVADLLAPNLFLSNGVHRPTWHPRPGIDHVEIGFVPWPLAGVPPASLMLRLVTSVRG